MKTLIVQDEIHGYEYKAYVRCSNCGWSAEIGIMKGTPVKLHLSEYVCPVCGCDTLEKDTRHEWWRKVSGGV